MLIFITLMEQTVLLAIVESEFSDDGFGCYCNWENDIWDYDVNQIKGALSSLVKKGVVTVQNDYDNEPNVLSLNEQFQKANYENYSGLDRLKNLTLEGGK
mgnify:FL=1